MDRLTTLVERFRLTVHPTTTQEANLVVLSDENGSPGQVLFFAHEGDRGDMPGAVLFAVRVDWAGAQNPLLAALPQCVTFDLVDHADTRALVTLMHSEVQGNRCGAQSVVNRLGEALMVRLLRDQIERGATGAGLLAGLSDARLSRAIVAMHDHPGRVWTNADLAQAAGLSLSRFVELFRDKVGETPMGYLRRWRLILARQDVLQGDRIDAIARRYAYASPDSFTRAFRQAYGQAPTTLRKN
ncbi:helix-turn-helix transcriptional regulator [Shimia aestuarii]|uniref:Cupin n=1 Tax=Shimia aestuarii TaxID=254406 RepID=A0A1I4QSV2_9RHOB|nr:AraC family transcriptional regulator [Shimia aestuarii]SFM42786.1 Cupin [Shimia aestuarii]